MTKQAFNGTAQRSTPVFLYFSWQQAEHDGKARIGLIPSADGGKQTVVYTTATQHAGEGSLYGDSSLVWVGKKSDMQESGLIALADLPPKGSDPRNPRKAQSPSL